MPRTTSQAVADVLGEDYQAGRSLLVFLDSAKVIVDNVAALAAGRGVTLSAAELEIMERWVAAYLYTQSDPIYASKSTGGASGQFVQGQEPERYKAAACAVDRSKILKAVLEGRVAGIRWTGKTVSEQVPWQQRN